MPRRRLGSGVPACALNVVSGCAPCLFCPDQDCWGHVTPGCGGQTHNRGTTRCLLLRRLQCRRTEPVHACAGPWLGPEEGVISWSRVLLRGWAVWAGYVDIRWFRMARDRCF